MLTSMILATTLVALNPAETSNTTAELPAPKTQDHAPIHVDVEIDPIAYALDGFSLHVGLNKGRYRLDLGAFGLAMPEFVHGQDGFDASFAGFGGKFDVALHEDGWGPFASLEGAYTRLTVRDRQTTQSADDPALGVGVRVGWRFNVVDNFYVVPWVGVGYRFGSDVNVAGRVFENNNITVFPTVHLGYRF